MADFLNPNQGSVSSAPAAAVNEGNKAINQQVTTYSNNINPEEIPPVLESKINNNQKSVPYNRFQEVINEKNALKSRIESIESVMSTFLSGESKMDIKPEDMKQLTAEDIGAVVKAQFDEVQRVYAEEYLTETFRKMSLENGAYEYEALSPYISNEIKNLIRAGKKEVAQKFEETITNIKKNKPFLFKSDLQQQTQMTNSPHNSLAGLAQNSQSQVPPNQNVGELTAREKLASILYNIK